MGFANPGWHHEPHSPVKNSMCKRWDTLRVSAAVIEEINRLKALYAGFHARELARIVFYKLGERIGHKTAQRAHGPPRRWRHHPRDAAVYQ